MFPGNPAVYIRSVAFRPCLATGLALLREVIYFKRLYDDVSGLSNIRKALRESFESIKIGPVAGEERSDWGIPVSMPATQGSRPVAMSFPSKNGRIAWCGVSKQGSFCRNLSA
jgi:hypothetical protein